MKKFICFLLFTISHSANATGFWDNSLINGSSRTEYPIGKGTGADFLLLDYATDNLPGIEGCQYDAAVAFSGCPGRAGLPNLPDGGTVWGGTLQRFEACGGDDTRIGDSWLGCLTYSQSPYFEIGTPDQFYWVIGANDDPSFDQCNEGPPNLSHPVLPFNSPIDGIYKVGMEDVLTGSEVRKRMQLGIYNSQHDFFCSAIGGFNFSIPFLSVGAQKERGNGSAVGTIAAINNGGMGLLEFKIRISSFVPFDCPVNMTDKCIGTTHIGSHAGIFAIASWNNVHHLLFLELIRTGVVTTLTTPSNSFWNWPVKDSFYYPGANVVIFTAGENLQQSCGIDYPALDPNSNSFTNYAIDIGGLFRCAKSLGFYPDLPDGEIEIEGVHWFVETLGLTGELSLEVEAITMNQDNFIFRSDFE